IRTFKIVIAASCGFALVPIKSATYGSRAAAWRLLRFAQFPSLECQSSVERRLELKMRTLRTLAAAWVIALVAGAVSAQTIPTATISGKVVDQQGLAVPGATVTAQSTVLQ